MGATTTPPNNTNHKKKRAALLPSDALWQKAWRPGLGESTIRKRINCLNPQLWFHTSFFCPCAQMTWIVLEEKKVKYKWIEINPYRVDESVPGGYTKQALPLDIMRVLYPEFMQEISPRGKVPAIRHTDDSQGRNVAIVGESPLIAAEYVDVVFDNNHTDDTATTRLMPTDDAYDRARMQMWCHHCIYRIQPSLDQALKAAQDQLEDQKVHYYWNQCLDDCRALANEMSKDGGSFFMGHNFTMVDVALVPLWQRIIWIGVDHYHLKLSDNACDGESLRRLEKWWRGCAARPSVSATLVSKPRLIAFYAANNVA